jgi:hypothetical protein
VTARGLLLAVTLLAGAASLAIRAARADADTVDSVKAALVHAAGKGDERALAAGLDRAEALVGKDPAVPDLGAAADLVSSLPQSVTSLTIVQVRVGWMYVSAKRGADAIAPLTAALAANPKDWIARSYLGEAKRLAGDAEGAAQDLARAWADGAPDDHVVPSLRRLIYDLRKAGNSPDADGMPAYAKAAAKLLAVKDVPDLRFSVAG